MRRQPRMFVLQNGCPVCVSFVKKGYTICVFGQAGTGKSYRLKPDYHRVAQQEVSVNLLQFAVQKLKTL